MTPPLPRRVIAMAPPTSLGPASPARCGPENTGPRLHVVLGGATAFILLGPFKYRMRCDTWSLCDISCR